MKLEEMLEKYGFHPVTVTYPETGETDVNYVRGERCLHLSRKRDGFFVEIADCVEDAQRYMYEDLDFIPGGSVEEILGALEECVIRCVVQKEIRTKIELVFLVRGYRLKVMRYDGGLVRALERDGETVILHYDREENAFVFRFLDEEDERDVPILYSSDDDVIDMLTAYLDTL